MNAPISTGANKVSRPNIGLPAAWPDNTSGETHLRAARAERRMLPYRHSKDLSREACMKRPFDLFVFALAVLLAASAHAQVAVTPQTDHEPLLASPDPRLAANKRLVYDFWREVFEAGHMELAAKYMAEDYIQHNPNVPTGRAAFVAFFAQNIAPQPIELRVKAPLVAILAEGNSVILVFVRELVDPKDSTQKYTTTWFDMFRLEGGKIAEHWDPAIKRP
jgi:predicted SnoaL-like aldol condensation-catalyzing enzyme